MKQYKVHKLHKNVEVAAVESWGDAECLSDFSSPWDDKPIKKIEFRALHSDAFFYFQFIVSDTEIHTEGTDESVAAIGNSDRVELFFRTDEQMLPYYCLEIDPDLRVMDFIAYPNKQFLYNWKWPREDFQLYSEKNDTEFSVTGRISKASLKNFDLIKGDVMEVGIFRAKYNEISAGEFEPTWITWVDPATETPNFHIKSSFGQLVLS